MREQILPFLKGAAVVLCFIAVGISAVCAFVEGSTLTIVSGVITLALDAVATIKAFRQLDKKDRSNE